MPAIKYKTIRPLVHLAVWTTYCCIVVLPVFLQAVAWKQFYFVIHFVILLVATYINTLVLVKQYFQHERYRRYLAMLALLWLCSLAAVHISGLLIIDKSALQGKFFKYSLSAMVGFSMEFFLLAAYKAAREWYLKYQRSKEAAVEMMQAELSLLRSQLDAHFIFNTLNNLYLLVLNKSDKAPGAILKLSDLLSYKIYDSGQAHVPLAREIAFIQNYISLQLLRLDGSRPVYFKVDGSEEGYIEPLILFNFIENAFKHADGLVGVAGQKYYVYIHITVGNNGLMLQTINSKKQAPAANAGRQVGIGLQNVRKRLNLAYPKMHELNIHETEKEYRVNLSINKL